MTGPLLSQLNVVDVVAGQPGVLDVVLEEHLSCPRCRLTGPGWQIRLGTPEPPPAPPDLPTMRTVHAEPGDITNLELFGDLPVILPELPGPRPAADTTPGDVTDKPVYRQSTHDPGG